MTQFSVNVHRFDPYKNFKFQIVLDGKVVAGVSKISALKRSTTPVMYREGSDPSKSHLSPGAWRFEPITLERGITHDPEFENWANLSYNVAGDAAMSLKNFRKDII
jgi:phage tail-like protein